MAYFEMIKGAIEVLRAANRMDLAEVIQDLREELLELREENLELKESQKNLKEMLLLRPRIVYEKGVFWIDSDEATPQKTRTPICPSCWQLDGVVNRLVVEQYMLGPAIHCSKPNHGLFNVK